MNQFSPTKSNPNQRTTTTITKSPLHFLCTQSPNLKQRIFVLWKWQISSHTTKFRPFLSFFIFLGCKQHNLPIQVVSFIFSSLRVALIHWRFFLHQLSRGRKWLDFWACSFYYWGSFLFHTTSLSLYISVCRCFFCLVGEDEWYSGVCLLVRKTC